MECETGKERIVWFPMKLYSMEEQEWRKGKFKRGDQWRSKEVSECRICGTRTNLWTMVPMAPKLRCPGSDYPEHDEILKTLERQEEVQLLMTDYELEFEFQREKFSTRTRRAMARLLSDRRLESILLQGKIDRLRAFFAKKALHDVRGIGEAEE